MIVQIPLVSIGFVESSGLDFLDIRGRTFRLLLCGIDDIQVSELISRLALLFYQNT